MRPSQFEAWRTMLADVMPEQFDALVRELGYELSAGGYRDIGALDEATIRQALFNLSRRKP